MNKLTMPSIPASWNPFATVARGWSRFWFSPADPTPLGLIRICCGLLTFYVLLAYTVDLQELVGANAWVDSRTINIFRYYAPFTQPPYDWDNKTPPPSPEPLTREQYIQLFGISPERAKELGMPLTEAEYLEAFGIHPRHHLVAARGTPLWSVWFHVTDPTQMLVVHGIILGIVFLFTIGLATRVTSVLTWMGVLCYTQRATTTLFGMDTMMNLLLIYLMIGPSGAALSVDRLIMRYWASWRALRARRPVPVTLAPAPRVSANLALRLIQVNLCYIYLISGLSKLEGKAWWNGTAVWGTMANTEFSPHFGIYWNFLKFLTEHRPLWELFVTGGVAFTLVAEIGFAFLIWNRSLRWVYLTIMVMLHTGIAVFMALHTFSLFMLTMLLAFVPVVTVQRLLNLPGRRAPRLWLEFHSRSRRQVRLASVVRAVDAWDQVEVTDPSIKRPRVGAEARGGGPLRSDAAENQQAHLIDESGEVRTGYYLFEYLVRSLRLLWPLAVLTWIPGVASVGRKWFPGEETLPEPALRQENGQAHALGEKVRR